MPLRVQSIANRQAAVCQEFAEKVLESTRTHYPADKTLARLFRNRKEQGARDRRLIRQVIFGMFRWWGWLQQWESSEWAKLLLIAYLLDRNPWNAVCDIWAETSRLPTMPSGWTVQKSLKEKQEWLSQYLQEEPQKFRLFDLIPPFFLEALAIPGKPGEFREELLSYLQQRTPLWIRTQTTNSAALYSQFQENQLMPIPHPKVAHAVELQGTINIHELSLFKAGAFEIQDLASQGIGLACAPHVGEHWWDVCAGGGGKSLHLAALMEGKGQVLSTEIRKSKLPEILRRAKRGHWRNIRVEHWDGQALLTKHKGFEGVLVDAPCSGTGTWSRNPDARWRTRFEDIEKMVQLQHQILEYAKNEVKPGSVLVYATCSLMEIENEGVVQEFLGKNQEFQLEKIPHPLTGEQTSGMVTILPHHFNSDGVFIARMRRV